MYLTAPWIAAAVAAFLTNAVYASTLTPPILPLIVRTPYLSAWLGNARDEPWSMWPIFWTGEQVRGYTQDVLEMACFRRNFD
jgi:hypothetical protein